jgi:hypothetical protein
MATNSSQSRTLASLAQIALTGSPVQQGQALRALDMAIAATRATSNTGTGGAKSAAEKTPSSEMCTVEVRYKPVALGADHAFIVTTDNDSVNYFRGGPQANNTGLNSPTSNSSSGKADTTKPPYDWKMGMYGPIVTEYGDYKKDTTDWTTTPSGQQTIARLPGNCNRLDGQFARHMNDIEAARINYLPLAANSNSTVRETLERAGFNNVEPVVWAPAWNTQLAMPK